MNKIKSIAIVLILTACTGCSSVVNKTLMVTQSISGTGSVSISTRLGTATVVVENARQDGDEFKADSLVLSSTGILTGTKVDINIVKYSRPIIKEK